MLANSKGNRRDIDLWPIAQGQWRVCNFSQNKITRPFIEENYLHIECKLQLGLSVRVIYFEQSVDKFLQVNIAAGVQIEH